ncbi:MAG: ATP-dependent helicase HrpB [Paludibacteraceae bacterium]|nr:ATP-dependent helicase HrpB [Paludibacteraceae bacterium]
MGRERNIQIDTEMTKNLPAQSIAEEVNQKLVKHNRLIITAAPGAGKSTLLPLTILSGIQGEGKILMLEPRRIAAKQIAERMADLLHEKVGETVGYRVRFEKRISQETRIEVLTEGILTRMLTNDPMLEGVSTVIFDEFHERSLPSDVALALTREAQQIIRPDLRIIIMSATIDASAISSELQAPIVNSEGRMFPVKIIHTEEEANNNNVSEQVAHYIRTAHAKNEGDILAFLPGQAEIIRCKNILDNSLGETNIYPLYGQLSPQEQRQAIQPSTPGQRKVVLSTSIAETSLTIEGVRIVIDSGLCKTMVFDSKSGLSHLVTTRISKDMAKQRAGRAGRIESGVCYQLWSLATEHRMEECREPEILSADLSNTALDIAVWGEGDMSKLPWLTPPPSTSITQASHLLNILGALDEKGKVTVLGRQMAELPCHPRISRMLVSSENNNEKAIATDIAAILEEKDPLNDVLDDIDINTRINLLRDAREKRNEGKWNRIARIAKEYRNLTHTTEDNNIPEANQVGTLIATAYPERIATSIDNCGRFKLANGTTAFVSQNDLLSSYNWISIALLNASSGKIFLASPVEANGLKHLSNTKECLSWDNKRGTIIATEEQRIGNLVLESRPLQNVNRDEIIKVICEAAPKNGLSMFDFSDDVARLQRRIECVSQWHPELEISDFSTEAILNRADEWVPFFLDNNGHLITSANEMKKIDVAAAIWTLLTYEQQQEVERLAPSHITVPTGSRIKVDYRQGAEAPIVSVRLQECFGLTDTPCVNEGKQPILMELLSPGFKPVQLTQDLRSFWNGTYFEVRKELKRRYPKHSWPDNPLEAEATKGVNKKSKTTI